MRRNPSFQLCLKACLSPGVLVGDFEESQATEHHKRHQNRLNDLQYNYLCD